MTAATQGQSTNPREQRTRPSVLMESDGRSVVISFEDEKQMQIPRPPRARDDAAIERGELRGRART
jgi:hypothetical protein